MTASDKCTNLIKYVLLCSSHLHKTFAAVANPTSYHWKNEGPTICSLLVDFNLCIPLTLSWADRFASKLKEEEQALPVLPLHDLNA